LQIWDNVGLLQNYSLSPNANVLESTGVALNLTGMPAGGGVAHPLAIVCRKDGAGVGGDVVISGDFATYGELAAGVFVAGPNRVHMKADGTTLTTPGAYNFNFVDNTPGFEFDNVFSSIAMAVLAEGDISFMGPGPKNLVGFYFAMGDIHVKCPTTILGTVYTEGQIIIDPGASLTVTADKGLTIEVPRGLPRRPTIASLQGVKNK
jgi:hypothetical protein